MTVESPFRQAALDARSVDPMGEIILIRPLSFSVITGVIALAAAAVLAMLFLGSYTKRSTINGQLVPDSGTLKVYAPQAGIVVRKQVHEGQRVHRGELMYVLTSERKTSNQSNVQESISIQVELRRQSLLNEISKTQQLQQDERRALLRRVDGLRAEVNKVGMQIEGQRNRTRLAEDALLRAEQLLAQNFISKEQLQLKIVDLLEQRNRLGTLERDQISVGRDLTSAQDDLVLLPGRQRNILAQIERALASTNQELTESEARRSISVIAPEDGIASGVIAESGQNIDTSRPMFYVIPDSSLLQADLYAPSAAVGFVQPGDTVLIRYQAFPFQKFGHARGTVISISKTALSNNELPSTLSNAERGNSNEPMYRIVVGIASQTLKAYGKEQALQAGMLLEADVLLETRRLYEWVLEPLYSVTGKI